MPDFGHEAYNRYNIFSVENGTYYLGYKVSSWDELYGISPLRSKKSINESQ